MDSGFDDIHAEARQAHRDGVKWWQNPYPSGSADAYEWDSAHTAARLAECSKRESAT